MAKKRRAKAIKVKKAKPKAVKAVKKDGRRKAALVLSIIAVVFLAINAGALFAKDKIIEKIEQVGELEAAEELRATFEALPVSPITLAIIWLVLAVAIVWTTYLLEHKKSKWYMLLIFGIITFLSFRWLAGILSIISSILYKR